MGKPPGFGKSANPYAEAAGGKALASSACRTGRTACTGQADCTEATVFSVAAKPTPCSAIAPPWQIATVNSVPTTARLRESVSGMTGP
jgi:hypothetical protein